MIDEKLIELTEPAKREHKVAKRKSDKLRITEDLVDAVLAVFSQKSDVTAEQKIAAFDKLHAMIVNIEIDILAQFQREGRYNEDDDSDHYIYEAAIEATLGKRYFDARNVFTNLMDSRGGDDD
jgi:hypothetical protein